MNDKDKTEANPLTVERILNAYDDEALSTLLSEELTRLIGSGPGEDMDEFVRKLRLLPKGLHAMASTYELDVSMALDDLGWHFANWHHLELANETHAGLMEFEAIEEAGVFRQAFEIVRGEWEYVGSEEFWKKYDGSELSKQLMPLNDRMWSLLGYGGRKKGVGIALVNRWIPYARKFPERLVST